MATRVPWRPWRVEALRRLFAAVHLLGKPQLEGVRLSYARGGLSVAAEAIPWNAETLQVDAILWLPRGRAWLRDDFTLQLPDSPLRTPVRLQPLDRDRWHLTFRLSPPPPEQAATLGWCGTFLGKIDLPSLSADSFYAGLRLTSPTLFAQVGACQVPCQAVVAGQARGIVAVGLLASSTPLLPLAGTELTVRVLDTRLGRLHSVPVRIGTRQLTGTATLVSATLPGQPCEAGAWEVYWCAGSRLLATSRLRVLTPAAFQRSLYVAERRYAFTDRRGLTASQATLPPRDSVSRVGPCFLVASQEPGVAGLCPLEIRTRARLPEASPLFFDPEALVTDLPSPVQPPLLDVDRFRQAEAFDLVGAGQALGSLTAHPRPAATFTSEGGFRLTSDVDWSPVADEELADRLARLMTAAEPCPAGR